MSQSQHPQSVLVAEDESLILAGLVVELEAAGFAVIATADAEEALRAFEQHPEVVALFTDINMPGPFDGLSLAHKIAKLRPDMRLILTSGRDPPPCWQLPKGACFLPKPYNYGCLTALIDRAA